jgi:hypothetical protein
MFPNTLKCAGIAVLAGGLALTGISVVARQDGNPQRESNREAAGVQQLGASPGEVQSARVQANPAGAKLVISPGDGFDTGKQPATKPDGPRSGGRAKDAASQRILAKLEEPIAMSFTADTPLEDVLKYIKQATTSSTYTGIPIYVDPLGLQEAEKSMTSTVRNMDLEGVPLRRTLQLLLKQIDLVYFVDDGLLCITSDDSAGPFPPSMREPSPILQKTEQAERGELSLTEMKELLEALKVRKQITDLSSGTPSEEAHEGKQHEELKQYREHVNGLLKEIRGLLEILKVERQKEKASETR